MNQQPSVFITGMGLLTAAGESPEENWNSLLTKTSHLSPIQAHDLSKWKCHLGGELTQFEPAKHLPDKKLLKLISKQDAYGLFTAYQALDSSALLTYRNSLSNPTNFNDRTGIFVGSPGNKYLQLYDFLPLMKDKPHTSEPDLHHFADHLFSEVHPMWLLRILPNNVLAYTGIHSGFKGPNHNIANHAVGGMQALIEAYHAIQSGQIDRAVVVGYDLGIDPQSLFYYEKLTLLSPNALRPFDHAQNGTVLANGAAALILENEASAQARGATRYAQILSGISKTEAAGTFGLEPSAEQLTALLHDVMHQANATVDSLSFIIAHGNGNSGSDTSEALALTRLQNQSAPPISAFKWSMGHTLVASGLVDTILATLVLQKKCLPGIATLNQPHSVASHLNLSAENRVLSHGDTALIINRGFASMNACLAIKACEPNFH